MTLLKLPKRTTPEAIDNWRAQRDGITDDAFADRSIMNLSEWSDAKRILSADLGEPGDWKTSRVPYMREPMNAITDPRVSEVTIIKPTRIGATQSVVLNTIGYYVDQEPSPIIVAVPTLDDASKFSSQLLQPMLDDTPCLSGRVEAAKAQRKRSTMLQKSIGGVTLQIIGTKSPRALRMVHGRIILMSEVDAFVQMAGKEGDPTKLLVKRAGNYGNPKIIRESSPLLTETSRIEPAYKLGTMEHFEVPCPHCGTFQELVWGGRDVRYGMKWNKRDHESAYYVCLEGCVIEEPLKYGSIPKGRWIAEHPERRAHRSFRLNSLVSMFDGARWSMLVKEFIETMGKPELLQVFVNTVLGQSFHADGIKVEAHVLESRFDQPYKTELPAGVGGIVRTFDVQGDRLETLVVGFGEGEEIWPIEHEIIEGDPGVPEGTMGSPWNYAATLLEKSYEHESGERLTPLITGIDIGGHHSKNVYAFVRNHIADVRVYGVQGSNLGQGVPLVSKQKYSNTGRTIFYSLGVFTAKEAIMKRLEKLNTPGPGYIHIPEWMDREQIEQLTAEELVTKVKHGRVVRMWQKLRDRNEFLDLFTYAFCLVHALGPGVVLNFGESARDMMAAATVARQTENGAKTENADVTPVVDAQPVDDSAVAIAEIDDVDDDKGEDEDDDGGLGLRERRGGWNAR